MKELLSPALQAENISFAYPGKKEIFSNLSFTLPAGKITVLAGCNGCGKSSLLRLFAGALTPQQGKILLYGKPLEKYSFAGKAKELGFVPQKLPEAENMTVKELLITGRLARKNFFGLPILSAEDEKIIQKMAEELDLAKLLERKCASLSGGEFRRAAIASVMVQERKLLLLDEPCASLDHAHALGLMQLLQKMCLQYHLSILLVSHDLILPAMFAENFVLMKQGRITAEGAPREVLKEDILQKVYDIPFQLFYGDPSDFPVPVPLYRK